jgi:hypothetical protein
VKASVKEGEQPDHSSKPDQSRLPQEPAQRGDGQNGHQKDQRPVARFVSDEFNGVGAQSSDPSAPPQVHHGQKTNREKKDPGPLAGQSSSG